MPGAEYGDSQRKGVVREKWNTPILESVHEILGQGYFYWGLPGKDVTDIALWRPMISRVVAFEREDPRARDPRHRLKTLRTNLEKLGISRAVVYVGDMEKTVLQAADDDGIPYERSAELVTLYNLDFNNCITGRVETDEGRMCLRFEVLRRLLAHEKECFDTTGASCFLILLTIREEFHRTEMQRFLSIEDRPHAVREFLGKLPAIRSAGRNMGRSPGHLKAFIMSAFRSYCQGHNISTFFLPPVKYIGHTAASPMMHFAILCRFSAPENFAPPERQTAEDFLRQACLRANDAELVTEPCGPWEDFQDELDPVSVAQTFFSTS